MASPTQQPLQNNALLPHGKRDEPAVGRIFLRSHGADVKLLHPSKHAIELLKVLHLLEMIPTFDDENLAVASFEGMATSQP